MGELNCVRQYGIYKNSLLITTREFGILDPAVYAIGVYAIQRNAMVAGVPNPRMVSFVLDYRDVPLALIGDGLLPADVDGQRQPKEPAPIVGTQDDGGGYGATFDALNIWELSVQWGANPSASLHLAAQIPVAGFDSIFPCAPTSRDCLPQPGINNPNQSPERGFAFLTKILFFVKLFHNMPIPTPFHSRTAPLCQSHEWRNWSGYLSAALYEPAHEHEYYAIRNAAALIDVSPLFKYEITGPDSVRLLNRIMTRDLSKCAVGQVMYTPWCDDDGKLIDDGTVARLAPDRFRVTAAEPNLAWFQDCALGLEVEVADISEALAALALQGPNARQVLRGVLSEIGLEAGSSPVDLETLKFYRLAQARTPDFPLEVSRTGYTGDLGYELWVAPEHAGKLWDRLVESGQGYGASPVGMVALDIARIEAGLLLIAVDYISARRALIEEQKSSPLELGLGWAVDLAKASFVGRKALLAEQARGSKWAFVGLEVRWEALERSYAQAGLPPQVAGRASRQAAPVYAGGGHPGAAHTRKMRSRLPQRARLPQVGQATSHTFSPLLKKYIALASLERQHAEIGNQVNFEITVEYTRLQAEATVVKLPFFNPPRKRV